VIRVDIRRTPGKLTQIVRGKSVEFGVGEILVRGAFNSQKAKWLAGRNHDPMEIPRQIRDQVRAIIRAGVLTFDIAQAKSAILRATELAVQWIRRNIQCGGLGRNTAETRKRKVWLVMNGEATGRYGVPPPYGVQTGHMMHSIYRRWRPSRAGK